VNEHKGKRFCKRTFHRQHTLSFVISQEREVLSKEGMSMKGASKSTMARAREKLIRFPYIATGTIR